MQFFKGTRINVYKTFVKDLLAAKLYLRLFNFINGSEAYRSMENSSLRFFYVSMIASHISSLISPVFLTPFDVAKTKVMCDIQPRVNAMYRGSCFKALTENAKILGIKSWWQGNFYTQLHSIISSALIVSSTHALSLRHDSGLSAFIALNTGITLLLYPIDTIM